METTTFVSNYIDVAASFGYNALQLYLEGRVGTKTFSLPAGERYTAEEMKGIVAHAAEKGIVVIPVVSFLGHAEHFFKYPGLEALSESRERRYRIGSGHSTFCHSVPGAVPFFERYIADLCEIFTGPYFHAGFDEAWNSGLCSLCAPKEKAGELFTEEVMNIYRILKSHGKRMMMWDDFFGFHPKALDLMPRDIVISRARGIIPTIFGRLSSMPTAARLSAICRRSGRILSPIFTVGLCRACLRSHWLLTIRRRRRRMMCFCGRFVA